MIGKHAWQAQILDVIGYVLFLQHPSDLEEVTSRENANMLMMMMSWCLMSSDVIWHIRDKLWPMPNHGSIKATYVRCMRV